MSESLLYETSGGSGSSTVTSLTVPVSSNPAGAGNKKILVAVSLIRPGSTSARTFTSVEYAGALTLNSDDQQTNTTSPATRTGVFSADLSGTTTGDIVITASGLCRIYAAVAIVDALQQLPTAPVTNKSTTLGPLAVTVDGFVFGGIGNSGNNYALTDAGSQTNVTGTPIATDAGTSTETNFGAGYISGGSGSQSFTWSSPNTKAAHVIAGYARVAAGGSFKVAWAAGSNIILGGGL